MRTIDFTSAAEKILDRLPAKHAAQIMRKIVGLLTDPMPHDHAALKGRPDYYRVTSGEYRVIYRFDETHVRIEIIGKRNDDAVYKQLNRR